ncbi:MAG TPA: polysaccharide ABC transporter ATP-binding protein [Gemmatimonadales bacterium]|nr:polysaccharide ABC transporter ATP-binding protein [Gemmatimonadales bacterium]
MSRSDVAIRVDKLGKRYRIGRVRGYRSLREEIVEAASAPFRRRAERSGDDVFWALRDVSFQIAVGEVTGIVGGNGAGKSTLLKILSRIVTPTEGRVELRGRVGSLLEVGTGFHPELTGRENVYMNGAILGMRKAEIDRKFDEIVAFAEIGQFLDTPVKRYSSGMQVRLAFAVAAHLEPEVLIVDEVLAVGDAQFQKKCLGKMQEVSRRGGRTVLFVSHNMNAVQRLCTRCLLLERGQMVLEGPTHTVVGAYLSRAGAALLPAAWIDLDHAERSGGDAARFVGAQYRSDATEAGGQPYPNGPLDVQLVLEAKAATTVASLAVTLYDQHGTKLVNADTISLGRTLTLRQGTNRLALSIANLHLNPGVYTLGLWLAGPMEEVLDHIPAAFEIEVMTRESASLGARPQDDGLVTCDLEIVDLD